jgi:regulator of replication initiation timing
MKPVSQMTTNEIRYVRDGLDKQIKAKGNKATPNEKELLARLNSILAQKEGVYQRPEETVEENDDIDFENKGISQVWYAKPAARKLFSKDIVDLKDGGFELPNPNDLSKTHVHLCNVNTANVKKIIQMLQGEEWSPNGEAKEIVHKKGLNHISITTGDIIVTPERTVMVTRNGVYDLGAQATHEDVDYNAIIEGEAELDEALHDAFSVGQTVYAGSKKGKFVRFSTDAREQAIIELDNGDYDVVPTAALTTKNPGMLKRATSWMVGEDTKSKKKV